MVATVLGASLVVGTSAFNVDARPDISLQQAAGSAADGVGGTGSAAPTVSADGRYVAYHGPSGSTPETTGVFVHDRDLGEVTELTVLPDGLRAGHTITPVISGDGCSVVVVTEIAFDVFRDDDTGNRWDLYRSRLPHCDGVIGDWELVSADPDTGLARDDLDPGDRPTISASGTLIAFTHPVDHLFDVEVLRAVSVVDLELPITDPLRTQLAAGFPVVAPNTTYTHQGMDQPALSGDGRYLAFRSDATSADAVAGWGTGQVAGGPASPQVFIWDRDEPDPFAAVRLVSKLPDGSPTTAGAGSPVLSRTGAAVAFTSADPVLVPAEFVVCDGACPTQVFHYDRDIDGNGRLDEPDRTALTMLSAVARDDGVLVAGAAPSSQPAISADGHLVAFVTKATNLQLIRAAGGGEATDGDLLVADAASGALRRVTVSNDGVRPALGAHSSPAVSETGRSIVFDTLAASDLLGDSVPGDDVGGRRVVSVSTPPRLSLADADLGTTVVGLESDEWYVAVINEGPSSFNPFLVEVSDSRFRINRDDSTCTATLSVPPGGDCTVLVTFVPTTPGVVSAELTVAEGGFGAVSVTSTISGRGGEPALLADPAGADLGSAVVGAPSAEFLVDIENIGIAPTTVADVRIGGAHVDDFAVTTNNCADRALNPRATCSIGITFTPTADSRRTALVDVATAAGQFTSIVLAGDGQFVPEVLFFTEEVDAGGELLAVGTGYPPNTEVTVTFGDGPGESVTGVTDELGNVSVELLIPPDERGGQRSIVVQADDGNIAAADVAVVEQDQTMIGMPGFGLG